MNYNLLDGEKIPVACYMYQYQYQKKYILNNLQVRGGAIASEMEGLIHTELYYLK